MEMLGSDWEYEDRLIRDACGSEGVFHDSVY